MRSHPGIGKSNDVMPRCFDAPVPSLAWICLLATDEANRTTAIHELPNNHHSPVHRAAIDENHLIRALCLREQTFQKGTYRPFLVPHRHDNRHPEPRHQSESSPVEIESSSVRELPCAVLLIHP